MQEKCFADGEVNKTEQFGTEGVSVTFQWPQDYSHNISNVSGSTNSGS